MKIIKVKKANDPWKPQGKNWTFYSAWCDAEYQGNTFECKVVTFTDKIAIVEGASYDDTEYSVTLEDKERTNENGIQKWKQITLKSPKKQWGKQQHTYTQEELENLFTAALSYASKNTIKDISPNTIFERYVSIASVCGVKIKNEAEEALKDQPDAEDPKF